MKLHKLLQYLHPLVPIEGENPEIQSIDNDNRQVQHGSLFICIKGYTVDGHDFAMSAVEKGAVAVIAEKQLPLPVPVIIVRDTKRAMAVLADAFYRQPSHDLHLIGITGTNGKTTTSHLIENIFRNANQKTGLIGTMYTKIAEKTFETKNTTPESLTLQKTFAQMVNEKVETAVMEVSSHALHLGRVHGVDFDIAVFTNLTQDHLDYHKTMEEYKKAKGLLFSQLGNTFKFNKPKFAVLNEDDPISNEYQMATAAYIFTYGIENEADVMGKNLQMTATGTSFDLITPFGNENVSIQMVGKFSVYNVLAAISAALVSGIPLKSIISTIESVKGVSGRFELVDANQDFTVIVDYAHTPDSLENVLKTVQQFARKRVFVIVGCGGDRDKTKRPLMAKIACKYGSDPIFTSDNPRSEDPLQIIKDMEAGAAEYQYVSIVDRKKAINYAVKNASEGDVIIIAGKGHETYQQIGNKVFDFDDRIVAKEAIKERI
ncbi:UDP-N-acetylmuramoyl-L-alanyl-D-glutamate--2,6-diaminopimelate ligase [Bacillus aquiflavi]|uniref:UDP-N-acetylmuramoyl-L-alanyl-D-glutamate--2,6-diaminopimelate ligase n=1 Tax=Bacillus aquiflavi TaxID=2672567 RepID=A0A6B3W1V1_9BACI|nr:UDP-N-acetylmuramoyl-L-alanyl-D-glutamate--2,6-diaminopimelate ligase [Bacillus aquiflavi]MBA4537614.1 UDP-N-acetylmuramoyl-L-alanyl-D-glutamate--2,6-diaminopimelate ligase [Bacillus aquiflavi]NEY81871.1 UDP-N-acetylmuramoyl-L-alanyl-D-glutamate--2,6-diaminopimelate ligase [Bacillus aquiflavi]UAC49303.1 UDP-N-acetylmuramoyl-L-alanyl-D-glutamate--2,6-diaminopimelate ligase [Bacillus aquiflavi]